MKIYLAVPRGFWKPEAVSPEDSAGKGGEA